jgi:DNA-binding MarR family transcriptional regulator
VQNPVPASRAEWPALIAASRELPPTAKLVALLLAPYADMDGARAWPGLRQLAWAAGLAPDTVGRKLAALCRAGYLQKTRSHAPGRSNGYRLTKPAASGGPATPPRLDA